MALTFANKKAGVSVDGFRTVEANVTFDDNYPTGGEAVSPKVDLGLYQVHRVEILAEQQTAAGSQAVVAAVLTNPSAPLLKLYTAASTEAANASDQSSVTFRARFVGKG